MALRRLLGPGLVRRCEALGPRHAALLGASSGPPVRGFSDDARTLPLSLPIFGVWGANTDVGKTLISVGLANAVARAKGDLLFLKPVQTGYPSDSDARLVCSATGGGEEVGLHAAAILPEGYALAGRVGSYPCSLITGKTLYAWKQAIGPHRAVELEGRPVSDSEIRQSVVSELTSFAQLQTQPSSLAIVETAGGVASPAPSGSLQCDLLRPLRLPAILVGDARLGGISATISALESLHVRGYDTVAVVLTEGSLANGAAISKYLRDKIPMICLPTCNKPKEDWKATEDRAVDEYLRTWLATTAPKMDSLLGIMLDWHNSRVQGLAGLAQDARDKLWWPFTQHANISNDLVTVLDGRTGDDFEVYLPAGTAAGQSHGAIQAQHDACASWWTQGLGAELQPLIAREMAYAAGRFGHLMFPENAHAPAVRVSEQLLEGPGRGWARRVFFSDDGSTALEVAVKMAFRKYILDHEVGVATASGPDDDADEGNTHQGEELHIIGLTESYHGDTLGCMDLSGPSPFNGRMQTPWYQPRGLYLDPPTVGMRRGEWSVNIPNHYALSSENFDTEFSSLEEVFCLPGRSKGSLAEIYQHRINNSLEAYPTKLAACVMEPVLQGAGGMRMIDPLWQAILIGTCKARGLPVILDEVFTGLWRLGRVSAAEMMGVTPDIACYAKLLTGGTIPMAVTVASEDVFNAFNGPTKVESLLHGHSYTAHPIGCHVASVSLDAYTDSALNPNYKPAARDPATPTTATCNQSPCACATKRDSGSLQTLWDEALVREISAHPKVKQLVVLGTVFAAELVPERGAGGGYLSSQARAVTQRLRAHGVFARPLGNVVYLMASPMTPPQRCKELLEKLVACL